MGSISEAETHKLQGNKLFKAKQYLKAAAEYSKACKLDKTCHVYPSNLAAALLAISKFKQALTAAESCIAIKDDFDKGHFRCGQALEGLERMDEAVAAYMKAAKCNPGNAQAIKKIREIGDAIANQCGGATPDGVKEALHVATGMEEALLEKEEAAKKQAEADAKEKVRIREETQAKAEAELQAEKERVAEESMKSAKQLHESSQRMKHAGNNAAYDSDRIHRFCEVELEALRDLENAHQYAAPLAIVLPAATSEEWGDEGCGIAINSAFESPDNHSEAQAFLRQHAMNCRAHAVLLIVAKDLIAFPRVWCKEGSKGKAQLEGSGGFFVQLQALEPKDRCMWWIAQSESGEWVQESLEYEDYQLMGTLLRKEE